MWTAITDIEYQKNWLALDGEFTPQIGRPFSLSAKAAPQAESITRSHRAEIELSSPVEDYKFR